MRQGKIISAAVLGILLALAAEAPAWAQVCTTECDLYETGQCVKYRQTCVTPAAPAHSFGAIAYGSKSGAWGESHEWDNRSKAESVALQNCGKHGNDCEVSVWFEHKCGAVASGDGTAGFWGLGDNDRQARAEAQNKCVSGGGKNCEVLVSQCSR